MNEDKQATDVEVITEYQDIEAELLKSAERRLNLLGQVKTMALKLTKAHDWVLHSTQAGPRPYLQATGAEAVARLFGVVWHIDRVERIDDNHEGTPYYVFEVYGTHTLTKANETISTYGARSSLDKFYQQQEKKTGQPIDWRDVKSAAISNFEVNGITRLLGLRNVTCEMLESANINLADVPGITYKKKGETGAGKPAEVEDTRPKLLDLVNQIAGAVDAKRADFLEVITEFEGGDGQTVAGIRSFHKLSLPRSRVTLGNLRREIDAGKYELKYDKEGKAKE